MADFQTTAALWVALSDLLVVKDIRRAIEANLVAAGGIKGALGTYTMPQHRSQVHDTFTWRDPANPVPQTIERRMEAGDVRPHVIDVTDVDAVCAARPALMEASPRLANEELRTVNPADAATNEPSLGHRQTPLVPPWRLPMPEEMPCAPRIVKWEAPKPDLMHKGQLVDLFL